MEKITGWTVPIAFNSTLLLSVTCFVYRLWLFSLTVRCSLRTVLTGMKPEVRCTSVASIVSLFVDVGKKTWPISHFAIESMTTYMVSHAYYTPPLEGF